ncbi:MAG: hypothetical protein ACE141_09780 [Bryobacteraceae bacterium]
MRRDEEFFKDQDVELIYVARKLSEAKALEALLTSAGVDYLVEVDEYLGGFLFQRMRAGAFFYVLPRTADSARRLMESHRYRPQKATP